MKTQDTTSDRPWRRRAWAAFKVVGLVVLVGVVLARLDLQEVSKSWRGISASTAALMCLCFAASMALRIGKWGWLARRIGFSFVWFQLIRSYLHGLLLGLVTPLRAGEIYRTVALELPPESELSRHGLAAMAWLLERIYELLILLLCLAFSLTILYPQAHTMPLFLGVSLGGLLLVLPIPIPERLAKLLPHWLMHHVLTPMCRARDAVGPGGCVILLAMTCSTFALNLLGGWLIYQLFGQLQAGDYLLRMPLLILMNNVPITIAGVGLRELSSMALFEPLGYPASAAAVAATILFLGVNLFAFLAIFPIEIMHHLRKNNPAPTQEVTE